MSAARPRWRRPAALLAGVLLLALAGAGVFVSCFDANRYKDDIAAAALRATGRELVLEGDLSLGLLPRPTLRVAGAKLANATWGSRPQMLEAGRLEVAVALWPLLRGRVAIVRVLADDADLLLETSASGEPNWRFGEPAAPGAEAEAETPAGPESPGPEGSAAAPRSLREIALRRVRLAWHNGLTQRTRTLDLDSLDLAAAGPAAPLRIDAEGRFDEAPFSVRARGPSPDALFAGEPVYRIEELSLELPEGDLAGTLTLSLVGGRPKLDADLTSQRLDLARLAAAEPAGAAADAAEKAGPVFSREPLPWDALGNADASVRLRAEHLTLPPAVEWVDLETRLALEAGALSVDPLAFGLAGGRVSGRFTLAAGEQSFGAELEASGVELPDLLAELGVSGGISGAHTRARLELRGAGASAHALAASLRGRVSVVSGSTTIRADFLDFLGPQVGSVLRPLLVGGRDARLDCAVQSFDIAQGVASSRVLFGEGTHVALRGRGAIDLGRERIDIVIVPKRKLTELASVPVPLRIEGPLASPHTRGDATASVVAAVEDVGVRSVRELGGAVTSLLGLGRPLGENMSCASAVAIADGGEVPPASHEASVPEALGDAAGRAGRAAKELGRGLRGLLPD